MRTFDLSWRRPKSCIVLLRFFFSLLAESFWFSWRVDDRGSQCVALMTHLRLRNGESAYFRVIMIALSPFIREMFGRVSVSAAKWSKCWLHFGQERRRGERGRRSVLLERDYGYCNDNDVQVGAQDRYEVTSRIMLQFDEELPSAGQWCACCYHAHRFRWLCDDKGFQIFIAQSVWASVRSHESRYDSVSSATDKIIWVKLL